VMEWKKASAELSDFLEQALTGFICVKKKMFGYPTYFVNGNMFAGVHSDNIFIRLSDHDRQEILDLHDEAAVFEPVEGKKMREYIVIPESILTDTTTLNDWLERSFRYASSLPPKDKDKSIKQKHKSEHKTEA
jgi:TfoX/Sxy family transcriptional regulator of competence genes